MSESYIVIELKADSKIIDVIRLLSEMGNCE